MSHDPKCYELAEYFLPAGVSEKLKSDLAETIQEAVEDWLRSERDRLLGASGHA